MLYTALTKKAILLCFEAHAGQVDKSGLPYVLHPLHLAEQMSDEDLPLEEGVRLYREAMKLFRETAGKLTEIEREIQILEEEDPGMEG